MISKLHPRRSLSPFSRQSSAVRPLPGLPLRAPSPKSIISNTYKHRASVANKRLTDKLNPLDATLTKNTGEGAIVFGLPFRVSLRSSSTYLLFYQPIANSFALAENSTLFFSNDSALFRKNTGVEGVQTPPFLSPRSFSYNRAALCGTPQMHLPCGCHHKMSVPRCANEWSPVSGAVIWTFEFNCTSLLGFALAGLLFDFRTRSRAPRPGTEQRLCRTPRQAGGTTRRAGHSLGLHGPRRKFSDLRF